MKKKSMLISLLTGILCISLIAGCGGGGRADSKYEGKYVSVVGEAYGMALTGEDIAGFSLELMSGGKAKMTIDGDTESAKWTNDDTNITLTISVTDVVGEIGTDTIKFVNLLDMGMDLTFAKEGTDAAKPENYLPEKDKSMLGKWKSYTVTDILGDDMSDSIDPGWLELEFTADHIASLKMDGEDVGSLKWSLMGDYGTFEDDDRFTFEIQGEEIEFTYINDSGDYTISMCKKIQ